MLCTNDRRLHGELILNRHFTRNLNRLGERRIELLLIRVVHIIRIFIVVLILFVRFLRLQNSVASLRFISSLLLTFLLLV